MELKDLLRKDIKECSKEELEFQIRELKKLKLTAVKAPPKNEEDKPEPKIKPKSNKEKQILNALSKLSPEDLKKLMERL